jgi:hypothetical protein
MNMNQCSVYCIPILNVNGLGLDPETLKSWRIGSIYHRGSRLSPRGGRPLHRHSPHPQAGTRPPPLLAEARWMSSLRWMQARFALPTGDASLQRTPGVSPGVNTKESCGSL